MKIPTRKVRRPADLGETDAQLSQEWLVTNGLGGYAAGTVAGVITRGFHGYLVAALPSPLGRMMMLNDVVEELYFSDGSTVRLGGEERAGEPLRLHGVDFLKEFLLVSGLPVWRYQVKDVTIEKSIVMPHGQNTVHIGYRALPGSGNLRLRLRPSMHFRPHNAPVNTQLASSYQLAALNDLYEVSVEGIPPLRFQLLGRGATLTVDRIQIHEIEYRIEASRGYANRGDLWSPGYLTVELGPGERAVLLASTEPWEIVHALDPDQAAAAEQERHRRLIAMAGAGAGDSLSADLVLAADQFIITPAGRVEDAARARAEGDEIRTVIAGYHWFTDWGRDTMISLEGLTLTTGRFAEAEYILRTFTYYIRDGLIPNMFPEGKNQALYHTADATLWFFHAIHRYMQATGDRALLAHALPKLIDIVDHHVRGTLFGIHVDEKDGLLSQGQEGYQLTWMDAKVDDWVVTPRRGKAVEINALWYNALCLLAAWLREEGREDAAPRIENLASRARESFQRRFWYEAGGYLYDVVDAPAGGDDHKCRPNQIFAISLDHPILDASRWASVVEVVKDKLLTPVGLRSLAPDDPEFKSKYDGDLRSRDAAYHQGTVWAWLIGPFVDAWLKVYPENPAGAGAFLDGFTLQDAGVGTISEIFDALPPFTPRGCVAQAWSVAEVLRSLRRIAGASASNNQGAGLATSRL